LALALVVAALAAVMLPERQQAVRAA
jgi:hypothetical protein